MDNSSPITHVPLPTHGPILCRRCFIDTAPSMELGDWRVVDDSSAWGSTDPKILILGFSKGFTQATAATSSRFEDIPFKGMRPRLTEVLQILGVLSNNEQVDSKMVAFEPDLAFGSLIRCSLSRYNKAKNKHECTGPIMPKAFIDPAIAPVVSRCIETYLGNFSPRLKLVILLGTGDAYINGCRDKIRRLHERRFCEINPVAYQTGPVTWVHAGHPSRGNGYHSAWMKGDHTNKQGQKRIFAVEAIAAILGLRA